MVLKLKITFFYSIICTICMVVFFSTSAFSQKIDTTKLSIKPKPKVVSKVPIVKSTIQPYKPNSLSNVPSTSIPATSISAKSLKILTVLKIYPNPVAEQLNISLRSDKETSLTVIIIDLLGNNVVKLATERIPAGEQTKTYTIPSKLNPGMYFLKILAGGEQVVKKISVL